MIAPTMSPLPSIGVPSAFTTRPSIASPTGTERMRPVALTVCPSSIASESPKTTEPINTSSRLSARPTVPSSNSSNSFTLQSGKPEMRAIPSPTSATRPTVRASSDCVKPSRPLEIAVAISLAENVMSAMSSLSFANVVYNRLFSWSRLLRMDPSMTLSPTVATMPPTTDGSIMTVRLICEPVAFVSASVRRLV